MCCLAGKNGHSCSFSNSIGRPATSIDTLQNSSSNQRLKSGQIPFPGPDGRVLNPGPQFMLEDLTNFRHDLTGDHRFRPTARAGLQSAANLPAWTSYPRHADDVGTLFSVVDIKCETRLGGLLKHFNRDVA